MEVGAEILGPSANNCGKRPGHVAIERLGSHRTGFCEVLHYNSVD